MCKTFFFLPLCVWPRRVGRHGHNRLGHGCRDRTARLSYKVRTAAYIYARRGFHSVEAAPYGSQRKTRRALMAPQKLSSCLTENLRCSLDPPRRDPETGTADSERPCGHMRRPRGCSAPGSPPAYEFLTSGNALAQDLAPLAKLTDTFTEGRSDDRASAKKKPLGPTEGASHQKQNQRYQFLPAPD